MTAKDTCLPESDAGQVLAMRLIEILVLAVIS